jgi:signal transduction histidine kinase
MVRGIVTTFEDKHINAKIFTEYLDTRRYSLDTVFPDLLRLYQTKYGTMRFDLIITTDNNALEFLRRCRSKLFFGIPIVFCGLDLTDNSVLDGFDQITGVVETMGEEFTVETALKLHPSAEQLVVVNNKNLNPIKDVNAFCDRFRDRKKVILIEITEFTFEQFLEKIGTFGLESIVLLPTRFSDSEGKEYTDEMVAGVMRSCEAPIYTNNLLLIGSGPVGGCINFAVHHGQIAAGMAIRILGGQNAKNVPIMYENPKDYLFDYNQLKHFRISTSQLPPNSAFVNEPKSFYYQHRKQVWLVTAVFVVLSMMVLVLLANVIRRKRMEKKLLEYHAQLKSLASELSLTEERERRRIAMELHDNISQSLVISKVMLEQLRESEASEHIAGVLDNVCGMLGKTVENSRLLTFDLGSPILYELGFETAVADCLTEQVHKHNIATEFEDDGQPKPLDDDVRGILFRMVRELLINVVKHAHAGRVKVSVRRMNNRIHVSVEDNGVGFNLEKIVSAGARTGGFGLFSIRERVEQLDGQLEIKSAPDSGCRVTIIAPLKT